MSALTDAEVSPVATGTDVRTPLAHYYPESIVYPQPAFPWTALCGRIMHPDDGAILRPRPTNERCVVCVELRRSTH